jgi:chorismate mutase
MEISKLRQEIDRIDREIISLLRERFGIVRDIARLKRETDIDVEDIERESQIMKNCKDECRGKISETFVEKLMGLIISESKKIQEKEK